MCTVCVRQVCLQAYISNTLSGVRGRPTEIFWIFWMHLNLSYTPPLHLLLLASSGVLVLARDRSFGCGESRGELASGEEDEDKSCKSTMPSSSFWKLVASSIPYPRSVQLNTWMGTSSKRMHAAHNAHAFAHRHCAVRRRCAARGSVWQSDTAAPHTILNYQSVIEQNSIAIPNAIA